MTYRRNHKCAFDSGSDSTLIREPKPSWRSRVCRGLRKSIMISESHPLAYEYLRSFPALVAERQRHLLENKNVIHPLSIFSLIWKSIMIFINLSVIICSSLRIFIIIEPVTIPVMAASDVTLFVLQAICLVDMIMRFNTGYLDCESALVELNHRRITWAYLRSFCLPDLLSCVPVSFMMLLAMKRSHYDYLIPDILPLARAVRIITVTEDLNTLLRTLTNSHTWYRVVRQILLFTLAIHCFTCLLFLPSVFLHYVYGEVPKTYTGFLDTHNLSRNFLDVPYSDRYVKGMFVAVSAFFSTGFNLFRTQESGEIIVNAAILLFGTMFKVYTIVLALRIYLTLYNSTLKYQELMDQVEVRVLVLNQHQNLLNYFRFPQKYMRHQQFPAALTRRLRDFYSYSFQERYYKESAALGCLSAHLKNEIRLHTFQTWIQKVPVLQDLPSSILGRLMGCLESEVYMPNDLLFHIGDIGIDLYFICTGTMVLYSMRGVEMYHFEDGDFFGALALMTAGNRRMTTLVAIEITHVYRLSYDNLRDLGPDLYDRIKTTTIKRFAKIMKVDKLRNLEELPSDKESHHS